jgi:hypothetical protein
MPDIAHVNDCCNNSWTEDGPSDSIQNAVLSNSLGHTQFHIQLATRSVSPGVKRPGRETELSPPSNIEVKNLWSCHLHAFMARIKTTSPLPLTVEYRHASKYVLVIRNVCLQAERKSRDIVLLKNKTAKNYTIQTYGEMLCVFKVLKPSDKDTYKLL